MFLLFASIGLALCLGNYLGEIYFGFFIISFCYLLIAILLYIFQDEWIKLPVNNFIINKMLNNDAA
jgi:hypothetical protein